MTKKQNGSGGGGDETSLERRSNFELERQSNELSPTQAMAEAQFDIQSAITIARRFPRDEVAAEKKLLRSAERPVFADEAIYSYPRGKKKDENGDWIQNYVEGPSVVLAREAARYWGNIRYGIEVTFDDEEDRNIRGYAYDMETNVRVTSEDSFKKLIQRKIYENGRDSGRTRWEVADERELRELTNKRGAICERNCILKLIPSDIIDNVMNACEVTLKNQAEAHKDEAIGRLVDAFQKINVSVKMIETKLGHSLKNSSAEELTELRKVFASIRDGNSSWSEYTTPKTPPPEGGQTPPNTGSLDVSGMTSGGSSDKDKDQTKGTRGSGSGKGGRSTSAPPKDPPKDPALPKDPPPPENPNYSESDPLDGGTDNLFSGEREPGQDG